MTVIRILAHFGIMVGIVASLEGGAIACGGMMKLPPKDMSLANAKPATVTPVVSDIRYGQSDVIDPGVLADEAQYVLNDLHFCYQNLLSRVPTAAGELDLMYLISSSGAVTKSKLSKVATGLKDFEFQACVMQAAYNLFFPASGAKQAVVGATRFSFYPIHIVAKTPPRKVGNHR